MRTRLVLAVILSCSLSLLACDDEGGGGEDGNQGIADTGADQDTAVDTSDTDVDASGTGEDTDVESPDTDEDTADSDAGDIGEDEELEFGCDCGSTNPANPCHGTNARYERDGHVIEFEFDCDGEACVCGRFADGWSYWVAPPTAGGEVTITEMTPATISPGTSSMRHGAEIDPTNRRGQGLTALEPDGVNRMESVVHERTVLPPFSVDPGDLGRASTIIKAIDHEERCTNSDRQCLEYVETLTVVEAPPGDVFRPPYFGTDKPLHYAAADLDLSILPDLPPLGDAISWDDALARLQSPHLEHNRRSFQQGMTAAVNHQVNKGYDQIPNREKNLALLKLVDAAEGDDVQKKEQLARHIVQHAIDLFYIHNKPLNADICGAWEGAGGFNGGNLAPILVGAALLGQDDWLNTIDDNLSTRDGKQCFAETGFIQANPEGRGKGIPTFGHLNTSIYRHIGDCDGNNRNCASVGGSSSASYDLYDGLADGDPLSNTGSPTTYQSCCTHGNWLGAAMTLWLIPEVRRKVPENAQHFLDYMERARSLGVEHGGEFGSYSDPTNDDVTTFGPSSNYSHPHFYAMWDEYKQCSDDASCVGMNGAGQ
jgi:hypothetical protein